MNDTDAIELDGLMQTLVSGESGLPPLAGVAIAAGIHDSVCFMGARGQGSFSRPDHSRGSQAVSTGSPQSAGQTAGVTSIPGTSLSSMSAETCLSGSSSTLRADSFRHSLTPHSLVRVASMSKPVTTLGALLLVEEGKLDLEGDISRWLGFTLRNPSFPLVPITPAMLLSHTSSIRDGSGYSAPSDASLREFFEPGSSLYEDGAHFAACEPDGDRSPGHWYEYSNLNYGVLATIMESISGMRFDLYMASRIFTPLGMKAGYNVLSLDEETFGRIVPLFRKAPGSDGPWNPQGDWFPQVDDYQGRKPQRSWPAARRSQDYSSPAEELDRYRPGVNGTLFSPQGGLRISLSDYTTFLKLFATARNDRDDPLSRAMLRMTAVRWTFNPEDPNGSPNKGLSRQTGLGLFRSVHASDQYGCDWLARIPYPLFWQHHGDAYGFLGGMFFDPESGAWFMYYTTGPADDPERTPGLWSSYFGWKERIQESVISFLQGKQPGTCHQTGQ